MSQGHGEPLQAHIRRELSEAPGETAHGGSEPAVVERPGTSSAVW